MSVSAEHGGFRFQKDLDSKHLKTLHSKTARQRPAAAENPQPSVWTFQDDPFVLHHPQHAIQVQQTLRGTGADQGHGVHRLGGAHGVALDARGLAKSKGGLGGWAGWLELGS